MSWTSDIRYTQDHTSTPRSSGIQPNTPGGPNLLCHRLMRQKVCSPGCRISHCFTLRLSVSGSSEPWPFVPHVGCSHTDSRSGTNKACLIGVLAAETNVVTKCCQNHSQHKILKLFKTVALQPITWLQSWVKGIYWAWWVLTMEILCIYNWFHSISEVTTNIQNNYTGTSVVLRSIDDGIKQQKKNRITDGHAKSMLVLSNTRQWIIGDLCLFSVWGWVLGKHLFRRLL